MNNKILSAVMAGALVLTSPLSVFAASFPDVSDSHTYAREIQYLKDKGIVNGYSDGNYHPEDQLTREAIVKIVVNAKYSQTDIENCLENNTFDNSEIFSDVNTSYGFAKYICIASTQDIVNGYSDGSFKPKNSVSFEAAAKIIIRALDANNGIAEDASLTEYLNKLKTKNIIAPTVGKDDRFKLLNRGEAAFFLHAVNEGYKVFPALPAPVKQTYSFMIKKSQTLSNAETGLTFRTRNYGIHCNTSRNTFVDLDVTKNGSTQQVHLERTCTGINNGTIEGVITSSGTAHGYKFDLVKVMEKEAWNVDSFEFYVEFKQV